MSHNRTIIGFEGNIGVGKSTLCDRVFKQSPGECIVYRENVNDSLLKLFYGNPQKYGFMFQMVMLSTRKYQQKLAERDLSRHNIRRLSLSSNDIPSSDSAVAHKYALWDRTTIGDYIFAMWNYMLGSISPDEMLAYESVLTESTRNYDTCCDKRVILDIIQRRYVDRYILLEDEPKRCKERVEKQRQNASESGIPLSYYEGIDDIHFSIFMFIMSNGTTPIHVICWDSFDDAFGFWNRLATTCLDENDKVPTEKKLSGPSRLGFIGIRKSFIAPTTSEDNLSIHYDTRESVETKYAQLKTVDQKVNDKTLIYVYINKNIMTVTPLAKHVVNNVPWVQFYENAYKRVVLYHLSEGHFVFFYNEQ